MNCSGQKTLSCLETMKACKIACIILATFAASWFALGQELDETQNREVHGGKEQEADRDQGHEADGGGDQSTSRSREMQERTSTISQRGKQLRSRLTSEQVCHRHCNFWGCTTYFCKDGVCCTPGSKHSNCCPNETPVCVGEDKCCYTDLPKPCGDLCCETDSFCCEEEVCCKDENSCCDQQCCIEDAPCCRHADTKKCCSVETMACCEEFGCVAPCESQFDAIGCQFSDDGELSDNGELPDGGELQEGPEVSDNENVEEPEAKSREVRALGVKLYRILRPDENPQSIVPKDITAEKTVLSHVNCGSRPGYVSQYISTSASLDVARNYKQKGEDKGLTGLRICEFDVNYLVERACQLFDLTEEANRNLYLGRARMAKNFAKASQEVLLICPFPVECTVIEQEIAQA